MIPVSQLALANRNAALVSVKHITVCQFPVADAASLCLNFIWTFFLLQVWSLLLFYLSPPSTTSQSRACFMFHCHREAPRFRGGDGLDRMGSELVDPPPLVSDLQKWPTWAATRTSATGALGDNVHPGGRVSIRHTVGQPGRNNIGKNDAKRRENTGRNNIQDEAYKLWLKKKASQWDFSENEYYIWINVHTKFCNIVLKLKLYWSHL